VKKKTVDDETAKREYNARHKPKGRASYEDLGTDRLRGRTTLSKKKNRRGRGGGIQKRIYRWLLSRGKVYLGGALLRGGKMLVDCRVDLNTRKNPDPDPEKGRGPSPADHKVFLQRKACLRP